MACTAAAAPDIVVMHGTLWAIAARRIRGEARPGDYVVTTLVTSGLVRRVAEAEGLDVDDRELVGFKWICAAVDRLGPERFVFGTEESHGYVAGTHVRDKDAAVAALLLADLDASRAELPRRLDRRSARLPTHARAQRHARGGLLEGPDRADAHALPHAAHRHLGLAGRADDVARPLDELVHEAAARAGEPELEPAVLDDVPRDVGRDLSGEHRARGERRAREERAARRPGGTHRARGVTPVA